MPPLPPVELLLDVAFYALLVPFSVAAVVGFVSFKLSHPGARLAGGFLAVLAGFLTANYFRQTVEFRLDPDHAWNLTEFGRRAWLALSGTTQPGGPPARYWLPWAILIVAVAGLVVHVKKIPVAVAWFIRAAAVTVAALLLVPATLRGEAPWLWPVLAVGLLANWQILDVIRRDARPIWFPIASTALFMAGATVLIHAHTARFTDIATILAGCWMAMTVVAWWRGEEAGGAIPITAVGLPGLLLVTQQSTYSEVPLAAFALVGLAPLALALLLFVPAERRPSWTYALIGWGLLAIPMGMAMGLAMRYETLSFE